MTRIQSRLIALLLSSLACLGLFFPVVAAETPAVRAVLFFSTSCGHCHYVIEEVLPPLFEQYGDQLQILGIEISDAEGQALYRAAIEVLDIPEAQRGVPTLIVGETVLVGSAEIPEKFPGLIEEGLANGGIEWPDFPGMEAVLAAALAQSEQATESTTAPASPAPATAPPVATAETVATAIPTAPPATESATEPAPVAAAPPGSPDGTVLSLYGDPAIGQGAGSATLRDRILRDPVGNMLSILVLVGMMAALIYSLVRVLKAGSVADIRLEGSARGALLALFLTGLAVAAYMAFVETTATAAVCGPVGDCNTVQQSQYASLFGFLPVGVLGILGYVALAVAGAIHQWGPDTWRPPAAAALLSMAFFGVLFSIYLTFLEPFVIGATCLWCLSSAVIMTAILLILVAGLPEPQPAAWRSKAQA